VQCWPVSTTTFLSFSSSFSLPSKDILLPFLLLNQKLVKIILISEIIYFSSSVYMDGPWDICRDGVKRTADELTGMGKSKMGNM
jgi:hypothetical protein